MPHSLKAKIKGLRYKGIITDKECDRLCKALDNENVLDKIRAEIEHDMREAPYMYDDEHLDELYSYQEGLEHDLNIIDKYRSRKDTINEKEEK